LKSENISVQELYYSKTEHTQCNGFEIVQIKENDAATIFVKKNNCQNHIFVVIGMILHNFLPKELFDEIEKQLRCDFIPVMKPGKRRKEIDPQVKSKKEEKKKHIKQN
jgi:hypothetical protein